MPNGSPQQSQRPVLLRRVVLFGVPALYVCLGLLHPTENPGLGDPASWFIALHVAQLFLIAGLCYAFWLLVDGAGSGDLRAWSRASDRPDRDGNVPRRRRMVGAVQAPPRIRRAGVRARSPRRVGL